MPELSDFRLGAAVETSDGRKVGTLVSILVEERGFEPKALVVKHEESLVGRLMAAEKLFITDEIVVPIGAVESATHDLVRLSLAAPDVRRQKPYLSHHFLPPTLGELVLQEATILSGGVAFPRAEEDADKPADEIEIERGENVMLGETGRKLGHVHEILFDNGEVVGVVIRPEGFFKQDVVLPIRFISRGDDLALFADLKEADVEQLKPYVEPHG
jgi:sporulation protein YlmC with PRC-barrel domain